MILRFSIWFKGSCCDSDVFDVSERSSQWWSGSRRDLTVFSVIKMCLPWTGDPDTSSIMSIGIEKNNRNRKVPAGSQSNKMTCPTLIQKICWGLQVPEGILRCWQRQSLYTEQCWSAKNKASALIYAVKCAACKSWSEKKFVCLTWCKDMEQPTIWRSRIKFSEQLQKLLR